MSDHPVGIRCGCRVGLRWDLVVKVKEVRESRVRVGELDRED